MGRFNLRENLRYYDEICTRRCGRRDDVDEIEAVGKELRDGKLLNDTHLRRIFDAAKTHFGHFWKLPEGLDRVPQARIKLVPPSDVSPDENQRWPETMVTRLFSLLGSIDAASILLQCAHPLNFAVYSAPILSFFQLQPAEPTAHYLTYCDEIKAWGVEFGIKTDGQVSARETDKALWVFYERAYGPARDQRQAMALRREFESDIWIRERRARNFLRPFLNTYDAVAQAHLLSDIDPNLAGKIAGCELERLINSALDQSARQEEMKSRIYQFAAKYGLERQQREDLNAVWDFRNAAVHFLYDLDCHNVQFMKKGIDLVRAKMKC